MYLPYLPLLEQFSDALLERYRIEVPPLLEKDNVDGLINVTSQARVAIKSLTSYRIKDMIKSLQIFYFEILSWIRISLTCQMDWHS